MLAEKALELGVLALVSRAMRPASPPAPQTDERLEQPPSEDRQTEIIGETREPVRPPEDRVPEVTTGEVVQTEPLPHPYSVESPSDAFDFLHESADADAQFFRASDDQVEVLVALFSDGRIRIADPGARRFAGMLHNENGEIVEIGSNEWSRVFVRSTPQGKTQLELHGGPYDTHVLACEPLDALGTAL